jgi:hypothetical protein
LNAIEIEQAISALAEQPFNAQEFPFSFLEAFGNKPTTLKRLRSGVSNRSDLGGARRGRGRRRSSVCRTSNNALGTEKVVQVAGL